MELKVNTTIYGGDMYSSGIHSMELKDEDATYMAYKPPYWESIRWN
jgi:hypothetical protein